MNITIDLTDGVPIYRQIVNQVRHMVASGLLEPGEEIPSIRALASRLKVTPNTVVKAFDELEVEGILEKRHGAGTFVAEGRRGMVDRERARLIQRSVDNLLREARQVGYSSKQLMEVIHRRLEAEEQGAGRVRDASARDHEPEERHEQRVG